MCGRYTLTTPAEGLVQRFLLDLASGPEHRPRYNVAPGQEVLAVVADAAGRQALRLRWGLTPTWASGDRPAPINARAETAAVRPMFRDALRRRRCLVPADGFFEWARTEHLRVPIRFTLRDEAPFAFAGLWERRVADDGGPDRLSCCILTTAANELVQPVHDRMPVILRREHEDLWLAPGPVDLAALEPVWLPYPAAAMTGYTVSRRVNSPANDDPACVQPMA